MYQCISRDVHKFDNHHMRSLQEKLWWEDKLHSAIMVKSFGKQFLFGESWHFIFYIFGSIWAFVKILSANFCNEPFCQSFLPPKFCIVQYTYHLNHLTIKTNLCVTNGWEDIAIWLSNRKKEIVFFFSLMLYHGGCFHWTHQRLVRNI